MADPIRLVLFLAVFFGALFLLDDNRTYKVQTAVYNIVVVLCLTIVLLTAALGRLPW